MNIEAILFDLDGTLIDTAPDLVLVLNGLLRDSGRAPMPYAIARNEVSNGAIGLLRLGFGAELDGEALASLRQRFLESYTREVCVKSFFFSTLRENIESLSTRGVPWGIVTNKPQAMTEGLLEGLGAGHLPGTVIGGDRLQQRKPHPAPLELAAAELGADPRRCVYIGDAPRDIEAGRAAGMRTVTAAYGYIRQDQDPASWGADALLAHPSALERLLCDWGIMLR